MTPLVRVAWAVNALFFATLAASLRHVDYVPLTPELLLLAFAIVAAIRPFLAIQVLAAAIPVVWYLFARYWISAVPWAEAMMCAAIAGLSVDAAIKPQGRLPATLRTPAILFATIVAASMIAALGVPALRLGAGFREALTTQLVREYFVDIRGFPAVHAGILLLEGVLLCVLTARIGETRPDALRRISAMAVAGATLAAGLNVARLLTAASRSDAFWGAIATLARTVRFNVHYADVNAAGSYFAMAALAAAGLAARGRGGVMTRTLWALCAIAITCALWLTGSRAAYLALIVAAAGAAGVVWLLRSGHRIVAGAAVTAAAIVITIAVAIAAPMRGNQHGWWESAGVRVGMARVAAQMIAAYPVFGIGLGEFYQRSGEFATPDLVARFPVAVHENAHNNFLQIAAELGLAGGAVFIWLVTAALILGVRAGLDDRVRLGVLAGLAAFIITWLGGHPLLVAEPAYAFWMLLGIVAAGTDAAPSSPAMPRRTWIVAACVIAILATVPWRVRTVMQQADAEHLAIGLSPWQVAPDGTRYREADGHGILFVPTSAFKVSVQPRSEGPVRVEVKLGRRIADIVTLAPGVWNSLTLPARTERTGYRYVEMQLRVLDGDEIRLWITKDEPIR